MGDSGNGPPSGPVGFLCRKLHCNKHEHFVFYSGGSCYLRGRSTRQAKLLARADHLTWQFAVRDSKNILHPWHILFFLR